MTSVEGMELTPVLVESGFDIHYLPGTGPHAVVSFSGIGAQPRVNPPFELIGSCSQDGRNHVIFVRDLRRTWYSSPGIVRAIADSVKDFAATLGVGRLSGIGNSMGGYGAILFAPLLDFRQVIAFAPQFSMTPEVVNEKRWPRWRRTRGPELARDLSDAIEQSTGHIWVLHGNTGGDRQQLEKFPVLDRLHHLVVPEAAHGLALSLKAEGKLNPFIAAALAGENERAATIVAGPSSRWRSPPSLAQLPNAQSSAPITRSGHCLCGAVSFDVRDLDPHYGICHCEMCRHWTGGAFFGITVPASQMTIWGTEHVGSYRSSEHWDRCWCTSCGASLWGHVHPDAPDGGVYEVQIGLFDDPNGLILTKELFADQRPDSYALAGDHLRETASASRARLGIEP